MLRGLVLKPDIADNTTRLEKIDHIILVFEAFLKSVTLIQSLPPPYPG